MATRLPAYTAKAEASAIIGDRLIYEAYFKDGAGNYISWTGYTFAGTLFDASGTVQATATCTVADGTPPGETASVTDGLVSVIINPADMPTKQAVYVLALKRTEDADATNVRTVLQVRIDLKLAAFDL